MLIQHIVPFMPADEASIAKYAERRIYNLKNRPVITQWGFTVDEIAFNNTLVKSKILKRITDRCNGTYHRNENYRGVDKVVDLEIAGKFFAALEDYMSSSASTSTKHIVKADISLSKKDEVIITLIPWQPPPSWLFKSEL